MDVRQETVTANGLPFQVTLAGEGSGPLVLLTHGFPELWHSWRHQIAALAAAGYRVAAPNLRGYPGSYSPPEVDRYTMLHLVGDVVAIVRALGADRAHIVGHDWGSALAWQAALLRPDIFATVTGMSVPFQFRNPQGPPIPMFEAIGRDRGAEFYMVRFQQPGVAEAEFEADLDRTFRLMSAALFAPFMAPGQPVLGDAPTPDALPAWTSAEDLAVYVEAYRTSGFRGPLNWYRNLDRNWELSAPWQDAPIRQPALYVTGEHDPVRIWSARAEARLPHTVPNLTDLVVVPGAGHWVQQEAPEAVNTALLAFLDKHAR
jgi:pimeloyl-ACP methyl ester carboxylesterase